MANHEQKQWTSPQQFVQQTPRGAYTTMRVRRAASGGGGGHGSGLQQLELIDWSTHLERLVRSLRALHNTLGGGFYDRYYTWLQGMGTAEHTALQRLLAPAIQSALEAAEQADAASQHLMLLLVLPPSLEEPSGLAVHALVQPCGPPGSSPGSAVVLGGPRSVPEGKDSGWVADRQPLERLRPGTAAEVEVLLGTEDGRLLEGLITNLFVVTYDDAEEGSVAWAGDAAPASAEADVLTTAAGAHAVSGCRGSTDGLPMAPVVWTAGVQDGVVWGTVRARVLEACRLLGYAVREEAPSAHSRHTWREAFLTNGLRLVQPLRSIACGAANVWRHPAWELEFADVPGPVTTALSSALLGLLPACPAPELHT